MMARFPPSVSRRLLVAVAVPLLLFFALTVVALDTVFRHLTAVALRQELGEQVVALVTAVDLDGNGNPVVQVLDPEFRLDQTGTGQYACLRDERGLLLWKSPSLAGTGLVLGTDLAQGEERILYHRARDGSRVAELSRKLHWEIGTGSTKITKTFIFSAADSIAPQMHQLWTFRREAAGWFGALALALLGTMAWMMRRALSPVRRLEQEIEAVETGAAMRLGGGYPRELAGVTQGLNALLESERNRIKRYRDTLGNLAHGLKTPLAVIRASLGSNELPATGTTGTTGTAVAISGSAAAIQLEIDRMAQIVEHQLKRAAAGGGATLGQTPVPVLPLVTELRAALLKVHARKDLRIEVDVPAALGFLGDSGDILELLGNILDNACKWCRSRVAVSARLDPDRVLPQRLSIAVDDDGPGIAAADRDRVMERGVRASEHIPGHGLGLSIVRETVGLYAGKFSIGASAALGGAHVELLLPGR
ncbi:MAG TPA: ATP-binding protein [Steroidobacteraceae bacterium]|jgi:two-component system sensor histidine kinase PhoQ|nr:ATP-binding protein [Steroidobacteraceae bacterium]